ncbi:hypothetical protein C0J52_05059 [Blattella germanica]|nr:hypothetical protein C0J52_05059 [Blattella germanica]
MHFGKRGYNWSDSSLDIPESRAGCIAFFNGNLFDGHDLRYQPRREREVESLDDETEDVPLPQVPAVAVPAGPGVGYIPSFYTFFPDFDLISRIRGLVTRLRTQIGDSFGDIDWNKGNTTSTTKTSYKDDDSDLVLHVKVIDVKPTEGAEEPSDESAEPTSPKEIFPSESSHEDEERNEIPKQPDVEGVAESLDFVMRPEESREHLVETRENLSPDYLDDVDTPVEEVDNDIEPVSRPLVPLHNDILVNKVYETAKGHMVMLPEDVEVFVPDDKDLYTVNGNSEYVFNPPYERFPISSRFQHRPRSESIARRFT